MKDLAKSFVETIAWVISQAYHACRLVYSFATELISSTSDTNTSTNNMSCACALLARSTRTNVLEVSTTELGLVLEFVEIVIVNSNKSCIS
jgi:acyl-CoA synthetase (AMP-forming)/AMP-acid ligase II